MTSVRRLSLTFVVTLMTVLAIGVLQSGIAQSVGWLYDERVDIFTDENTSYIGVFSDEANYRNAATLMVRCAPHEATGLDVFFTSPDYLGTDSESLMYRFDDAPPVSTIGIMSGNGSGVFLRDADIRRFVTELLHSHDRLAIQFSDFRGRKHNHIFDISGFSQAFSNISDCYRS